MKQISRMRLCSLEKSLERCPFLLLNRCAFSFRSAGYHADWTLAPVSDCWTLRSVVKVKTKSYLQRWAEVHRKSYKTAHTLQRLP